MSDTPDTRPVVVIDGPSGSGKSSVSRAVATRLGMAYLDTGAMYRALTWWCLDQGVDLDDEAAVTRCARELPLRMGTDPGDPRVVVGDVDVTAAIRETRISSVVSKVARHLPTRDVLIAAQRRAIADASARGIVAEGRDLTTVVAPDADVRLIVTASEEARLARRARELHGDAGAAAIEATRDQIVRRDRDDAKVTAFLEPAPGVLLLDTSDIDLETAIGAVVDLVRDASNRPAGRGSSFDAGE